jgi:hypothetical protein
MSASSNSPGPENIENAALSQLPAGSLKKRAAILQSTRRSAAVDRSDLRGLSLPGKLFEGTLPWKRRVVLSLNGSSDTLLGEARGAVRRGSSAGERARFREAESEPRTKRISALGK